MDILSPLLADGTVSPLDGLLAAPRGLEEVLTAAYERIWRINENTAPPPVEGGPPLIRMPLLPLGALPRPSLRLLSGNSQRIQTFFAELKSFLGKEKKETNKDKETEKDSKDSNEEAPNTLLSRLSARLG